MVIKELLYYATSVLKKSNSVTPQLDATVLLCYVLKCDRVFLIVNDKKEVSTEDERVYFELVDKRKKDMPIAYIVGKQEFMSLDFYVDENVLIPRPDTEILVEHIINIDSKKERILDMCCGSGCIGISLAYYLKNSVVHMADVSEEALKIAKKNAENILAEDGRVDFFEIDILKNVPEEKYDILVSNPPYIDAVAMKALDKNVIDYEPKLALFGGDDGLKFYRRIANIAPDVLNDGGILVFEIGEDQGDVVTNIMKENGFKNIVILDDLAGRNRVVEGRIIKDENYSCNK